MRKPLGVTLALVATILLRALGIADAQKGPIKVGLILPETGPLAANGKDMANGMQLFFEEQGWRLAGREVKLTTEDDEGKPPTGHYSAALPNPANKKFVQAYEAKFKQIPSYYSEGSYVAGLALKAALEATGGDIENTDKFLAALRRVDLTDAPRGPVKFDDFGNPVQNIYVRKVERVGGKLQNTVIFTFPSVSQFWTYKPEDFLKNPVYSRDYPPCTKC
jgi:ABC-type branched-subunit amino acid transport system substrate-binding protein